MTDRVYLDWNATAPLRPEARDAMLVALQDFGNPSSVHAEGRAARAAVERARAEVAALVGARPQDVIFTSGGTESNMLALDPSLRPRLLVSAVEHASVLAGGRFAPEACAVIPVDGNGVVSVAALRDMLDAKVEPALVSVHLANNETGVVQPIADVARAVREAGGLLHTDAVQAPGRIPCEINALHADLLTISSHKIGGPQGVGALIRRPSVSLHPAIRGGGQERGLRAGTENVAGIVGFGAAAAAVRKAGAVEQERLLGLQARLERGLKQRTPDVVIFGEGVARLPNTTLAALSGQSAEMAVIALDLAGVAVSSGSACSSGKVGASHVLAAMGVPPGLARGAIRISLGHETAESDIDRCLDAWVRMAQTLYNRSDSLRALPQVSAA